MGCVGGVLCCYCPAAAGIDPYDRTAEAPHEVVSFSGSFHGRTLGALALTYKDAYKIPFAPLVGGAIMAPYLDLEAAAAVIKKVGLRCMLYCSCMPRQHHSQQPHVVMF